MKKKVSRRFTIMFAIIAFFIIVGIANADNGGSQSRLCGNGSTVRKPKAVLCAKCGNTHYNTECEGNGDGCDPTGCPY